MKRRIRNKQRFLYLSPVVQKGTDELFIDGKGRYYLNGQIVGKFFDSTKFLVSGELRRINPNVAREELPYYDDTVTVSQLQDHFNSKRLH